ncbi:MAG: aminopeptidase P family protein [Epsilonproteobacteria bacterium]|nr:aminopeptidase P family protein [Campylobacterota bacterium]
MDNFILNKENEIYYECGYSCDNAIYLQIGDEKYFITDGRYTLDALENAKAQVITTKTLLKTTREIILKKRVKTLIIDPLNWDYESFVSLHQVTHLTKQANYSHKKRIIKTPNELDIIKKAVKLGADAFEEFKNEIKIGDDEYELSYKFKEKLTNRGKRELSFEPIVAINQNSAKPHAVVSDNKLQKNDILLLDAGIKYKRYCSDRTRSIAINENLSMSKTQIFQNKEYQKIYDIVLQAQEKALNAIKVGMKISELDKIARDFITQAGYGKYFVHSLGHGVGLDIHELPYVNSTNDTIIQEGMVFTIEPGIYLPDKFGVRIEDMVCINYDSKVEIL